MSALAALAPYDPVFDAQKHYRTLLACTARPGTIGQLDDVALEIPPQLNRASALLALTLLSADSTFYLEESQESAVEFLRRETLAATVAAEQADFVFLADPARIEEIERARTGALTFPEQGATVVLQVAGLSLAPMPGSLRLRLTGPGIETDTAVFVSGTPEALFEALRRRNAEFPLGIDAYLTCDSLSAGPCVLALPRTTRIKWERM
jgi:alpha-D-ribose 1-methylphosphonate 5-triphosphate synthase subunit PhnH